MAIIDLPTTEAFKGASFSLGLDVSESTFTGFLTGNRTRTSNLADRMRCVLTLPPVLDKAAGAAREAFLFSLRSRGDLLRMPIPHRKVPAGTLRGSPTAAANVSAGARSLSLQGCTAGANVFTPAVLSEQWLTGWTPTNASITYNTVESPVPGSLATTVTRTATGNHRIERNLTLASTSYRSLLFDVWLKAGTYTGNVRIIIADDASGNQIIKTVALTGGWLREFVFGSFPAAPAANVRVFVDPVDDAGSAGQTFFVWFSGLQVQQAQVVNAYYQPGAEGGPPEALIAADHLFRAASGDHYSFRTVSRSIAAGETWTYSCWMRLVSLTGQVGLYIFDNVGTLIQSRLHTVTGSWQRFSVTGTFAGAAAGITGSINPANDGGAPGDILAVCGEQMEPGSTASAYDATTTLAGGDFIDVGGNLLQAAYGGATADITGRMTLPLVLPAQKAIGSGAAVNVAAPTGLWELDMDGMQLDYSAPVLQGGVALQLRQVIL